MTDVGKRYQLDGLMAIVQQDALEENPYAVAPTLASRHNDGKAPLSMILEARHALAGMAGVLEFGAKKYARGNWHKGLLHADICDSMLRHLSAYLSGEDIDPESGKPHVDHIFCNAMFLAEGYRTHPELDNRSEELKRV
ncbi:hypothetical protein D3C72_557190 [compost metagenome]